MDERNIRILQAVADLGTGSPDEISEYTDIPKSTVHYRLTKLKEDGIVTDDLFDVDLEKLGLEITVISEVIAEYEEQYHDEVGKKLAAVEGSIRCTSRWGHGLRRYRTPLGSQDGSAAHQRLRDDR